MAQTAPAITAYEPLTGEQRWKLYWKDTLLAPDLYIVSLGVASVQQLWNNPPEWRQGIKGYGRRAGSELGYLMLDATIHQSVSAAMGYDPRYLPCECKGFWRRSGHALVWTFLTKNREGHTRFDFPSMAGIYGGEMLSEYWYPQRYTPLGDGFREANEGLGFRVGVDLLREFAPDVKRMFRAKP